MQSRGSLRNRLFRACAGLALGTLLLVVDRTAAAEGGGTIVVDMERAVFDTEDGLRVEAIVRQLGDIRERELRAAYGKLQADQQDLQKGISSGKLTEAQAQAQLEQLQKQAV